MILMPNHKLNFHKKITFGSTLNQKFSLDNKNGKSSSESDPKKISTVLSSKTELTFGNNNNPNQIFDTEKCVIHLIDLTPIHIPDIGFLNSDNNLFYHDGDDDSNINSNLVTVSNIDVLLQKQLEIIIEYIIDQHYDLWDKMKRGDLIEDIGITQYNDCLNSLDKFMPTKGRYIVDNISNTNAIVNNTNVDTDIDKINANVCLKGSDIIRNGLTIKYLVVNSGPNMVTRYTTPIDMHTITDFPIGYFDNQNIITNNYLCPKEKSRTCWGFDNCLVSLDINRLRINNLSKDSINHTSKNLYINDESIVIVVVIDYLYIITKFNNIKYMIISEYSSKLEKYDMNNEIYRFIDKFSCIHHMDTYNIKDNDLVKDIANDNNILIDNVLCI